MKKCYKCNTPRTEPGIVGFQDVCSGCESYLHCCMNCRFYNENAHNNCTEPQAEYVSDTHGMNHCEYFTFRQAHAPLGNDPEDPEARRQRRRPDWRNLRTGDDGPRGSRQRTRRPNPFGDDAVPSGGRARNPFGDDAVPSGGRARNPFGDDDGARSSKPNPFDSSGPRPKKRGHKARDALDELFEKPEA